MNRLMSILLCATLAVAQRPSSSSWGQTKLRPPPVYKTNQQSKYSDSVPPISFDSQTLPANLPIQAPNGVIEIYNRVIDDLIIRLENDFKKRSMDPLPVVIRPTPPGPVRVPGRLQKRPFRGQGAALQRYADAAGRPVRRQREVQPTEIPAQNQSSTDVGKTTEIISSDSEETTTSPRQPKSSETERDSSQARSDELFPDDDDREIRKNKKKKKQKDTVEEELDDSEEDKISLKDVSDLLQKFANTNAASSKEKYKSGNKVVKPTLPPLVKKIPTIESEDDDDEESHDDYHELGASDKPQVGVKPQGGPPGIPAKPNAQLFGLSKIKRSSDVTVTVDARSAVIRARLLVGPLDVYINESIEPHEKNVKASIPELEAEMLLMERHGVMFLQRFTLDHVYGQDVEITIPKALSRLGEKTATTPKPKGSKKGSPVQPTGGFPQPSHPNPNHPSNLQIQRFQTKMAAHVGMEIVHLLRSGKLRGDLLRVAQESISKLKLPIQKRKNNNQGQGQKKVVEGAKDE